MSADDMRLEYKLSRADLTEIPSRRLSKLRWFGVLYMFALVTIVLVSMLVAMSLAIEASTWWIALPYVPYAAWFIFGDRVSVWVMRRYPSLLPVSIPVRLDVDARGIRSCYPDARKTAPSRYWWSRLLEVREDRFGATLFFDTNGCVIPWKAFDDESQQARFLQLARQHLLHEQRRDKATVTHEALQRAS